ncbi:putative ribonuclease H-like domain-containing protein [Tanacetum coccineum]|uniref:Ribonuclease H-like domain-containing protein n=1 Tax=Tanacetum coccineum TaxID=301880 RepID=A0ABQ4XTZ2_9ASTR
MDVKSAFLYGTIKEEVYVCQPPSFEDPQFPNKVYKVEKALYGLHQVIDLWTNKALLKDEEAENVDVHLYRSMIGSLMYLTAFRPDIMFTVCTCARDSPFVGRFFDRIMVEVVLTGNPQQEVVNFLAKG